MNAIDVLMYDFSGFSFRFAAGPTASLRHIRSAPSWRTRIDVAVSSAAPRRSISRSRLLFPSRPTTQSNETRCAISVNTRRRIRFRRWWWRHCRRERCSEINDTRVLPSVGVRTGFLLQSDAQRSSGSTGAIGRILVTWWIASPAADIRFHWPRWRLSLRGGSGRRWREEVGRGDQWLLWTGQWRLPTYLLTYLLSYSNMIIFE